MRGPARLALVGVVAIGAAGLSRADAPPALVAIRVLDSSGVEAADDVAGGGDPLYPLVPGQAYRAHYDNGTTRDFRAPVPREEPGRAATMITRITPEGDALPENTLRFYIHFSRPMRMGEAGRRVALIGERGDTLRDALLGLETELWDPARTRLTVLLDPGRIKRGLRPNLALGSPLRAGHRYRLAVDAGWPDEDGMPLGAGGEAEFAAGPAVRARIDVSSLVVTVPRAGTRDPIIVKGPAPFDEALVRRLVSLGGATASVTRSGTIAFHPAEAWRPGAYTIVFGAELEDVAGNSFQRAFDRDLAAGDQASDDVKSIAIPVRIP